MDALVEDNPCDAIRFVLNGAGNVIVVHVHWSWRLVREPMTLPINQNSVGESS